MKKYNGKKTILAAALLIGTMSFGFAGVHTSYAATPTKVLAQASQMKQSSIRDLDNDTRVFAVDKSIEAKNVRFENRYGFEVAGHLYLPKDFNASKKYNIKPSLSVVPLAQSRNNPPGCMLRKWLRMVL
jgi:hypothetical protein